MEGIISKIIVPETGRDHQPYGEIQRWGEYEQMARS